MGYGLWIMEVTCDDSILIQGGVVAGRSEGMEREIFRAYVCSPAGCGCVLHLYYSVEVA
jgi:hypothetical protein